MIKTSKESERELTVADVMVENLIKMKDAMETILDAGLTKEMIITLVHKESKGCTKTDVRNVMDALFNVIKDLNKPYRSKKK